VDHWGISGGSLMGVVVAYLGAAVVHIGSSGGSLVVQTVDLQSWV
jgi:hypothetical protein